MVAQSVLEIARAYAARIRTRFPVKRVILYGSFARGTQKPESDIDVAVVLTTPPVDTLAAETELFTLRREIDMRIEPVIVEESPDLSGFYEKFSRYGTVVFSA